MSAASISFSHLPLSLLRDSNRVPIVQMMMMMMVIITISSVINISNVNSLYDIFEFQTSEIDNETCNYVQIESSNLAENWFPFPLNTNDNPAFADLISDCAIYSAMPINNPYPLLFQGDNDCISTDDMIFDSVSKCAGTDCPVCMCDAQNIGNIKYGTVQTLRSTDCYACECTTNSSSNYASPYQSCTLLTQYYGRFDESFCPPKKCTFSATGTLYDLNDVWWHFDDTLSACAFCTCMLNTHSNPSVFCESNFTAMVTAAADTSDVNGNAMLGNLLSQCLPSLQGCLSSPELWYFQQSDECNDCPICDCPNSYSDGQLFNVEYMDATDNSYVCSSCMCFDNEQQIGCAIDEYPNTKSFVVDGDGECPTPLQCYVDNIPGAFDPSVTGFAFPAAMQGLRSQSIGCPYGSQTFCGVSDAIAFDSEMNVDIVSRYGCMGDWLCDGLLADTFLMDKQCISLAIVVDGMSLNCSALKYEDVFELIPWNISYTHQLSCCSSSSLCNNYTLDEIGCDDGNDTSAAADAIVNDIIENVFSFYPACVYNEFNAVSAFGINKFCASTNGVQTTHYFSRCDFVRARAVAELGCICSAFADNSRRTSLISDYQSWFATASALILQELQAFSCSGIEFDCLWNSVGHFRIQQTHYNVMFYIASIVATDVYINEKEDLIVSELPNVASNSVDIAADDATAVSFLIVRIRFDYAFEMNEFYAKVSSAVFDGKWGNTSMHSTSIVDDTFYYIDGELVSYTAPTAKPTQSPTGFAISVYYNIQTTIVFSTVICVLLLLSLL